MVKFAWPSLSDHWSCCVGTSGRGGISEDGRSAVGDGSWLRPLPRWKDEMEGFVDRGGEGRLGIWGELTGVCMPDGQSGSAMVGDCNGD